MSRQVSPGTGVAALAAALALTAALSGCGKHLGASSSGAGNNGPLTSSSAGAQARSDAQAVGTQGEQIGMNCATTEMTKSGPALLSSAGARQQAGQAWIVCVKAASKGDPTVEADARKYLPPAASAELGLGGPKAAVPTEADVKKLSTEAENDAMTCATAEVNKYGAALLTSHDARHAAAQGWVACIRTDGKTNPMIQVYARQYVPASIAADVQKGL